MTPRNIATVFSKELRDSLRDRRTLISMFVVPTLAIPVLVLVFFTLSNKVVKRARAEILPVMVLGAEKSPEVRAGLQANPRLRLLPGAPDFREAISEKRIRAAVEIPDDFDAILARGEPAAIRIFTYGGELKSGFAADELERHLRDFRETVVRRRLEARGLPPSLVAPFTLSRQNVAPPEKVGGALFGGMIPYFIILLSFTGAMYPAIDLAAGEKERGTMETLLCSPVGRSEIVLGKFFMVLAAALATVALAGLSALITLPLGAFLLTKPGALGAAVAAGAHGGLPLIDPAGLAVSLLLVVPVAVLFSAVLFTLSLFAKTHKEAQSYVSPLIVLVILPAGAALLPGMELNGRLALVPVLNVSLACKELVSGVFNWGYLTLIFGSTCIYALGALALAVRMFNRESVIFRT